MIYPIFPTTNGSAVEERVAVFTNFRGLWLSNRLFPLLLFHTTQMGLSKCDLLPNLPESLLFKTDCDMSLSFSESSQLVSGEHKQVPGRLEISCLGSCHCEIMCPFTHRFHPWWEIYCHHLYLFQQEHFGSSGTPDIIDRKIILSSLLSSWSLLITCHRVVPIE